MESDSCVSLCRRRNRGVGCLVSHRAQFARVCSGCIHLGIRPLVWPEILGSMPRVRRVRDAHGLEKREKSDSRTQDVTRLSELRREQQRGAIAQVREGSRLPMEEPHLRAGAPPRGPRSRRQRRSGRRSCPSEGARPVHVAAVHAGPGRRSSRRIRRKRRPRARAARRCDSARTPPRAAVRTRWSKTAGSSRSGKPDPRTT